MSNNSDASASVEVVFEYQPKWYHTYLRINGRGGCSCAVGCDNCTVPRDVTIVRFHPRVNAVGNHAFEDCYKLREVVFNERLQRIDASAFSNCTSLSTITFPSTVTKIDNHAFYKCSNLREVEFNDGLKLIGTHAFYECTSLPSITFPSAVTTIREWAFSRCDSLSEVVFNDGLKTIRLQAFSDCTSLSSITLPSTVTEIGDKAFRGCNNLREVVFHEGLQKIEFGAFDGCTSLSSITIPSTVAEIGYGAFCNCRNLREVVLHGVPRKIGLRTFDNCASLDRFTFPTISTRLDNLIKTGHWEEIENEVNEVLGVVERSSGQLFVSAQIMGGGNNWIRVRDDLDKNVRLISRYEVKEGTSIFELALWKLKLDQVDKANPIPRKKCRMDVPGPVKDTILQYLPL